MTDPFNEAQLGKGRYSMLSLFRLFISPVPEARDFIRQHVAKYGPPVLCEHRYLYGNFEEFPSSLTASGSWGGRGNGSTPSNDDDDDDDNNDLVSS